MATSKTEIKRWGWEETGPAWGARAFAPKSGQDHLGLAQLALDGLSEAGQGGVAAGGSD